MSMSNSPTAPSSVWWAEEWAPRVEQATQGRVKVTFYWAETLGKLVDWWDMLREGVCDVADIKCLFYHGTFPLNEDGDLPFFYPWDDPWKCLQIKQALWDEFYGPEFADVKVLNMWISAAVDLIAVPRMIKTMDDLKGLQIGCPQGPLAGTLSALGATPAGMAMVEGYMAMDRGVIDGFALPCHTFVSLRLGEIGKNVTLVDMCGGIFQDCMNWDTWNSLLPQDQKAMDEIGNWATQSYSEFMLDEEDRALEWFAENGVEVYVLPAEEKAKWRAVTAGLVDKWAADMDSKGKPGTKLVQAVRELAAKP